MARRLTLTRELQQLPPDIAWALAGSLFRQTNAMIVRRRGPFGDPPPRGHVARYGGEEFVVLLPNTGLDGAMVIAREAMSAIRARNLPHDASDFGRVTVSIGAACVVPDRERSVEGLIGAAGAALYAARRGGRDRVDAAALSMAAA